MQSSIAIPEIGLNLFRTELGQRPTSLPEQYVLSVDAKGNDLIRTSALVKKHLCYVDGLGTITFVLGFREQRNRPDNLYLGQATAILHDGGTVHGYMNLSTHVIGLPGMLGANMTSKRRLHLFFRARSERSEMSKEQWVLFRILAGFWNLVEYLGLKPQVPIHHSLWESESIFELCGGFNEFVSRTLAEPRKPYDEREVNVALHTKCNYRLFEAYCRYRHRRSLTYDWDVGLPEFFDLGNWHECVSLLQDFVPRDTELSGPVLELFQRLLVVSAQADSDLGYPVANLFQPEPGIARPAYVGLSLSWYGGPTEDWRLLTRSAFSSASTFVHLRERENRIQLLFEVDLHELYHCTPYRCACSHYMAKPAHGSVALNSEHFLKCP